MRAALEKSLSLAQRFDAHRPTAESKHSPELALSDLADLSSGGG
jgi:hypothetical protein